MRFVATVSAAGHPQFSRNVVAFDAQHATDTIRESYERHGFVVYAVSTTQVEQFEDVSNVLNAIS